MERRTLLVIASVLVAALGTALVWMYVQGADDRAQATWGQQVRVFVATEPINPGASYKDLETAVTDKQVPRGLVPEKALRSLTSVETKRTAVPILAGQVLVEGQFDKDNAVTAVGDGRVALSVAVDDPNRVAGLLHPNARVAIYAVGPGNGGAARLLLGDVRVLGVGSTTNLRDAEGETAKVGTESEISTAVVSLDLAPDQPPTIMSHRDSLYFVLLGKGAKVTQQYDVAGVAAGQPSANG